MLIPEETKEVEEEKVTRTYKLDLENKRIVGMIDGSESITQNALKTLLTERYAYEIYSSDVGVAFDKYIGKDFALVKANLKKEIADALSLDKRVIDVQEVSIEKTDIDTCSMTIYLNTIEGQVIINGEVSI